MRHTIFPALCAIVALCQPSASGAIIAYEGFDYPAGDFTNGLDGGFGWGGAWTGDDTTNIDTTIEAGSLDSGSVPGFVTSGNHLQIADGSGGGSGDRFSRPIDLSVGGSFDSVGLLDTAGNISGPDFTSLYISFVMEALSTTSNVNSALELNRDGSTNIISFGADTNNTANYGLNDKQGTENDVAVPFTTNTNLWVVKITYGPGAMDTAELFLNPTSTVEGEQVALGSSGPQNLAFDDFGFLNFSNSAGHKLDEIRIGTTFASVVVPEPATLSLLGLIAAPLVAIRRRVG